MTVQQCRVDGVMSVCTGFFYTEIWVIVLADSWRSCELCPFSRAFNCAAFGKTIMHCLFCITRSLCTVWFVLQDHYALFGLYDKIVMHHYVYITRSLCCVRFVLQDHYALLDMFDKIIMLC